MMLVLVVPNMFGRVSATSGAAAVVGWRPGGAEHAADTCRGGAGDRCHLQAAAGAAEERRGEAS